MVRLVASLFLLQFSVRMPARDIKVVEGSSVYVVPRSVSLEEAESIALQRAITEALAAEFGTIVQSEVWTEIYNGADQSSAEAWSNGLNMVKGEWLETIGKPDINLRLSEEGYVVEVHVKGKAVAIESGKIDVKAEVKQADAFGINSGEYFKSGNRLIVDFGSPVNGNLSIFLADANSNIVQLLPFAGDSSPSYSIQGGVSYTFFADNSGDTEESYYLYTEAESERNLLYIVFSPNHFTCPFAESENGVRMFRAKDFRKWLTNQRASDSKMQTVIKPLIIKSGF